MSQHTDAAEPQLAPATAVVKYGYLAFIGEFDYRGDGVLVPNQTVLVETERGIELGRFLCYSSPVARGLKVCPAHLGHFLQESGSEYLKRKAGKLIRPASPQDLIEEQHIHADAGNKKAYCMKSAERFGLKMKVVCVEHLFGGERIIFYFAAEGRVDFRELVRELAREYQTRIELRQIGARDEARLLADYEICGRECCCKNFLKTLRPVNMKMAKLQKATLDPSKVSGRCGRLRCCLRYEQKTYEDLLSRLPAMGSWVQTPSGTGRVKDRIVLTQLVQVAFEDDRLITFPVEEISPATDRGRGEPDRPGKPAPPSALEAGDDGDEPSRARDEEAAGEDTLLNQERRDRADAPGGPPASPQDQNPNQGQGDRRDRRNRGRRRRR